MSKIIGGPVTQAERSATPAKDLYKGMDCGRFDPEKSDHIHGRSGSAPLLFSAGRGLDTRQFCPVHGRRWAWCGCARPETVTIGGIPFDVDPKYPRRTPEGISREFLEATDSPVLTDELRARCIEAERLYGTSADEQLRIKAAKEDHRYVEAPHGTKFNLWPKAEASC